MRRGRPGRRAGPAAGALPIAAALVLLFGPVAPTARADEPETGSDTAPDASPPSTSDATSAPEPQATAPPAAPAAPPAPEAPRETIVVTAPAGAVPADPSAFATVVRVADLDEPLLTLPEALRRTVGVQVRSLGGEFATVSIRGSSPEQVVVYLDGVPLNDALGGGVNLANVPLAGLDSIEVYRGSTPPSLSSASIGGAILLHSRRPADGNDTGGFVTVGSYGTAEAGGSWGFGGARGDGLVALDFGRSEGDYLYHDDNGTPFNSDDDQDTPRVNNDFRRGHLTARGGFRAGSARITVGTDLFDREQGVPGTDAWPSTDSRLRTGRMLLHAGAEAPGLAGGRLLMRGLVSRLVQDQEFEGAPGDLGFLTRSTDNRTTSTGAESSGTWVLSARQGLSFLGALRAETADLHDRLLDPSDRGHADRRVATFTAEDTIETGAGRIVIAPSLRHERWRSRFEPGPAPGVVPPATDDQDSATTGRLGLRVRLREGLDLRANAGSFLRLPDLTELYGDQGSIVGNADLRPESGVNADLGVQATFVRTGRRFHHVSAEAVVFQTRAEDLILYVPNAQSTVVARNIGAARIRGLEIGLGFGAGRRFSGSLNATRQEAIDTSDRYTEGNYLPLRPRDEISASAGLAVGRGRASWDFTYVGPNYTDTVNSESGRLPSRYLHDLAYRRPLTGHLEASFEVHNLFDDRSEDVARFPLPGRAFAARLQWAY